MWRGDGDGELYTYFPPGFSANDKLCNIKPFSECNPEYGASVGRGSFQFARGAWTTVAERVKLNDVAESNGEVQLWVNGKSVIDVRGVVLRARGAGKLRGIQFQTFFGGKCFVSDGDLLFSPSDLGSNLCPFPPSSLTSLLYTLCSSPLLIDCSILRFKKTNLGSL